MRIDNNFKNNNVNFKAKLISTNERPELKAIYPILSKIAGDFVGTEGDIIELTERKIRSRNKFVLIANLNYYKNGSTFSSETKSAFLATKEITDSEFYLLKKGQTIIKALKELGTKIVK